MSFLKAQVNFPLNFPSIFSAIKQNSPALFSSNIVYFGQKEPIKVQVFETFKRSGQISNNIIEVIRLVLNFFYDKIS